MQTFLPYPDFYETARVLDVRRLGKQRVEVLQLLHVLLDDGSGWKHHPAVRMWRGSEGILATYGLVICGEWITRGYRDTCFDKIEAFLHRVEDPWTAPWWLGEDVFHRSHRSNLLRKYPEHYRTFWPDEADDLDYFWPERPPSTHVLFAHRGP